MRRTGFTLIEMLVVMAIMATLLSIAAPRYFDSLARAREAALRTDLRLLREAIDKFHADSGRWPARLDELVTARYLRELPPDPITNDAATWQPQADPDGVTPGIHDVRSGAPGTARNGSPYAAW